MILTLPSVLLVAAWTANLTVAVGGMSADARVAAHGCWHDPESGCYLYKTIECDGSHAQLTLTKDRRMVLSCGFEVPRFGRKPEDNPGTAVEDRKIELATKNGIRIGMTREEVEKKLGAPTRTAVRGEAKQFWCALCKKVVMTDRENGRVLRNTYIFKHGKLIEISINRDSVPGCGDDSRSDEGWPWSRFWRYFEKCGRAETGQPRGMRGGTRRSARVSVCVGRLACRRKKRARSDALHRRCGHFLGVAFFFGRAITISSAPSSAGRGG